MYYQGHCKVSSKLELPLKKLLEFIHFWVNFKNWFKVVFTNVCKSGLFSINCFMLGFLWSSMYNNSVTSSVLGILQIVWYNLSALNLNAQGPSQEVWQSSIK